MRKIELILYMNIKFLDFIRKITSTRSVGNFLEA